MADVASEVRPDDPVALERGRVLFAQACDFFWAAARLDGLPDAERPEIAFAGRSNVGKSSLINGLTGRNSLARTSNTPGRTQELIFFNLGDRLTLVDLPGYGYAKVSKSLSEGWTALVRDFLRGRPTLARVFLLVDSRHGVKPSDEELMKMLDQAAVSYQVVLTKIDKLKPGEADRRVAETAEIAARHVAAHPDIIATSAEKGTGLPLLRAYAAALALP